MAILFEVGKNTSTRCPNITNLSCLGKKEYQIRNGRFKACASESGRCMESIRQNYITFKL